MSRFLKKLKDSYRKIMNLPDAPNKIAGGVAVGLAMDFLPIPFISIPISYILARAVRLNGLAAALTAVMCKVFVPLFYALNIMVGRLILGGHIVKTQPVSAEFYLTSIQAWLTWFKSLGVPFLLGAVINATLAFLLAYFSFKKLLLRRQQKYQQRITAAKKLPEKSMNKKCLKTE